MRRIPFLLALGLVLAMASPARALERPGAVPDSVVDPCDSNRVLPIGFEIVPAHPCAGDSISLVARSCRDCVDLISIAVPDTPAVIVHTRSPKACPMTLVCTPDSLVLPLGRFAAGTFHLGIQVRGDIVSNDSILCTLIRYQDFAFTVGRCLPPPTGLPYLTEVRLGRPSPCIECPPVVCPGDSIPAFFNFVFPSDCFVLRRVDVLPVVAVGPPFVAQPPVIRFIVDDMACLGRLCLRGDFPQSAFLMLPPLPTGNYELAIQEVRTSCSDSVTASDSIYFDRVPFAVAEQCSTTTLPGCLLPEFDASGRLCNATVGPDRPAEVVLRVRSSKALSGLQGSFSLYPAGLRIRNLEAIGPAAGMHLAWTGQPDGGARFLLFAEAGAPIPPGDPGSAAPEVLRATVVQPPGVVAPPITHMIPGLLGADIDGTAVPECMTLMRLAPIQALICAGTPCDFNGDGRSDIRDLVVMVHCVLRKGGACPDTLGDFDCNRDGRTDLDDVFCCARTILRGDDSPPDSIPGRPEPSVQVSFGEPVPTASGLDVPLHLSGANRIGAARLALAYPRDRFDVASVDLMGEASDWLNLHEVTDDALVLGLICMGAGGTQSDAGELDLMLHLTLKPGQSAGGELRVGASDFSGPDGATLQVELGSPTLSIGGPTTLAMTAGRPNPFSSETRFTLSLSRASEADIVVHDLSGRKVAVLQHGMLEAGGHAFSWNGTRSDGTRAPQGIYFIRARAGGRLAAIRVVLLRGN